MPGISNARGTWLLVAAHLAIGAHGLAWGAGCAADPEVSRPDRKPKGQYSIFEENDVIAADDENYTQGLRVAYTWSTDCEWRWMQGFAHWFEATNLGQGLELATSQERAGTFGIGQHIFTPKNLKKKRVVEDDRPYAGWLYATLGYDWPLIGADVGAWDTQARHSLELQLGVVGKISGAEAVQTWLHTDVLTGSQIPMGWDNQLHDELGFLARYQWQRRFLNAGRWLDISPGFSVTVGTIQMNAAVNGTLRLGRNITGFPTQSLRPTIMQTAKAEDESSGTCWGWLTECYLFAGVEGKVVGYNLFLDGSTFSDSHSVHSDNFVYDLNAGFRLRFLRRNITFEAMIVRRSREFEPVPKNATYADGSHKFGSFAFRWDTYFK